MHVHRRPLHSSSLAALAAVFVVLAALALAGPVVGAESGASSWAHSLGATGSGDSAEPVWYTATPTKTPIPDCGKVYGYKKDNYGVKLSGWVIKLYDANHTFLKSATTDVNGYYEFTNLPAGTEANPNWRRSNVYTPHGAAALDIAGAHPSRCPPSGAGCGQPCPGCDGGPLHAHLHWRQL